VRGQVERGAEGADAGHGPHRKTARQAVPALVCRTEDKGHGLAVEALGLLGREPEGEHASVGLDARVPNGLARLAGDQSGDLIAASGDTFTDLAQCRSTLVGRQHAHGLEAAHGGLSGGLVLLLGGQEGGAGDPAGMGWMLHLQVARRLHPAAGEIDGMGIVGRQGVVPEGPSPAMRARAWVATGSTEGCHARVG
jgi:hypothetical protein